MIRSRLTPYEGSESYIFVSYAHKDSAAVCAIMDELAARGYRIWYDDGIAPGSEWPEYIAEHLNNSEVVLAFISPNSIASSNCRREVTFALSKKKRFIAVILEPTEMSLGMEMQLSAQQCVMKYNYATEEDFYQKLCGTSDLQLCKEEKREPVSISEPITVKEEEPDTVTQKPADKPAVNAISPEDMKAVEEMVEIVSGEPQKNDKPEEVPISTPAVTKVVEEKKPRKKGKLRYIILGAVAAIALFSVISMITKSVTAITLSDGTKIEAGAASVNVHDKSITQEQLKKIGKMKKLNSIRMQNCVIEGDFSVLSNAGNIKYLELENSPLDSYAFLADMPNLIRLNLDGGNLGDTDAAALQKMESLTNLNLAGNKNFTNIAVIPTGKLTELILDDTGITNIDSISNCQGLRVLSISRTPITDFTVPFNALRLEQLEMQGLDQVKRLDVFENLTKLRVLKIAGCKVRNIAWIELSKETLKTLDISGTALDLSTFKAIGNCTKIEELYMNHVPVNNLDLVSSMLELKVLQASSCKLDDVSGITKLAKLKKLWLNDNKIREIKLSHSENLEELNLAHNNIETMEGVIACKYLAVYDNPIDLTTIRDKDKIIGLAADYDEILNEKSKVTFGGKYFIIGTPVNKLVDMEDLYRTYYVPVTEDQLESWIKDTQSLSYFDWPKE